MLNKAESASTFEKSTFAQLIKVDEAKQEVWTVVTAEQPDRDDEVCDYATTVPYYKEMVAEMSKATDGKNIFPLREMHGLTAAGKGIAIEFRDKEKQIYMGFKVVDPLAWEKVKEGVYSGVSQGGRYIKRWKDGDYTKYTAQPIEVSLVDLPCLKDAHFDFIRSNGAVEVRKFVSAEKLQVKKALSMLEENLNGLIRKATSCTCKCTSCEEGKCAGCTADTKCAAAKAVKYLVNVNGEKHLPYTNEDGTVNHRLLGAAWAALHGGYRGNKYAGPNSEQAKKKLRQLYAAQGLDTPTEKAEVIDGLLKSMLTDAINSRAFGELNKGMYTVSRFAQLTEDIKYLWLSLEYEREQEGDESPVTDELRETFENFLEHLLDYTEEQISEEKSKLKL